MAQPRSLSAAFRCPTARDVLDACLALLPRGRAWQTHESGPLAGQEKGFTEKAFDDGAFATQFSTSTVLRKYWQGVASVFAFVTNRLCDLRLEFWCASQTETNDLWMAEYGLPDTCDPFPDLCTKVAAIGGTRCEYYATIAARAGWSIACVEGFGSCGTRVGARRSKAGIAQPGHIRGAKIAILVDMGASTAFASTRRARPKAGRLQAGGRLACGPDISALECLLARVVHAEIEVTYGVIQ